ncbi:MAG: imidazole glycerol phosphate synthase subunit HisH [Hydrogenophaga sp.]|nr:imidazole glycerol phosphate synthase subunit HisH [Hydrogenophaga sp.]
MIRIVDYGVGNIQAFMTMFRRLGIPAERACKSADLEGATRLILPGVGHFDHAMQRLVGSGMLPALETLVCGRHTPIMGVCVGMQMLAEGSDEGRLPGLNWVPGRVRAFASQSNAINLPMPHMGWNDVHPVAGTPLFSEGFDDPPQFYFLHSFYFDARDKADVAATAHYGLDFDAVVSRGHIHGVQCHPEKSHHWGAQLLKNFAKL